MDQGHRPTPPFVAGDRARRVSGSRWAGTSWRRGSWHKRSGPLRPRCSPRSATASAWSDRQALQGLRYPDRHHVGGLRLGKWRTERDRPPSPKDRRAAAVVLSRRCRAAPFPGQAWGRARRRDRRGSGPDLGQAWAGLGIAIEAAAAQIWGSSTAVGTASDPRAAQRKCRSPARTASSHLSYQERKSGSLVKRGPCLPGQVSTTRPRAGPVRTSSDRSSQP